jgi:plastocyanin
MVEILIRKLKKINILKCFWVFLVVVILSFLGYHLFKYKSLKVIKSSTVKTIQLTENGFEPKELKINLGDTIVFSTNLKSQFWPASDLHPTHLLYPEFDPKKPIEASQSWAFKFEKPGVWTYHNHLNPTTKGTVVVVGTSSALKQPSALEQCEALSDRVKKDVCWGEIVDFTLNTKGITGGFALMRNLLQSYPDFEPECHTMSHKIGAKAFEQFANHEQLNLTPDVSLCGYGFFHGFTETLASTSGNISDARQFCQTVLSQLGSQFSDIGGQCYHGFGHGSVETYDPTIWGNEEAMIKPAIELCTAVADNSERLFRCGTGVFDSISIAYFTHQYKLVMNPSDPFWLCKKQSKKEFERACYVSFDPALMMINKFDFTKSAREIEKISDDSDSQLAMGSLALPPFWVKNQSDQKTADKVKSYYENKAINDCRKLQDRLHNFCLQTLAYALTIDEQASTEYKNGLKFCQSGAFSQLEKDICFSTVWNSIKVTFPLDKVKEICLAESGIEDNKYCKN